jgi:hypothetical protein
MACSSSARLRRDLINSTSQFERTSFWTDAELAEKIEHIVRFYRAVHAFENRTIHRLDRVEGTITISDDVFMAEVKIGSEPSVRHEPLPSQGRAMSIVREEAR